MMILSFGEQALADAKSIETLARVIGERPGKAGAGPAVCIVLSELAGIRGRLLQAAGEAQAGQAAYQEEINRVRERHVEIIQGLFPAREQSRIITPIQILLNDLEDILHGVQLIRECTRRTQDLVLSLGVRCSCILVSEFLRRQGLNAQVVEEAGITLIQGSQAEARVDYTMSYKAIRRNLEAAGGVPVIPGGIATTEQGVTTLLRRDGSDLSASLIGAALQAELIELWTDRDGVMSSDPAYVREAFVLPELSYQEAMELSYFGAHMVHPQAMVPAMELSIPLRVRNLARPELPGTLICSAPKRKKALIAGIASIEPVALVNVEGGGMVGVPGIAARLFGALARAAVNIIMISQASSEHSICVVFRQEEAARALQALKSELEAELAAKQIQNFDLLENLAIVAVIGEGMRGTPGISGRLFSSLGREGINILAIAQGSSETNISFVIDKADEGKALQTIHRAFLAGEGGL